MALTLALDVVGVIFSPFAVAGVFGTLAIAKAVSRALTPGLEAPGLHLVHTGAAALTPRLDPFCGSCLIQTSRTGVEAGTRGMVLVLVLVLVEGLDNVVLQHTEALPQAAQRGCRVRMECRHVEGGLEGPHQLPVMLDYTQNKHSLSSVRYDSQACPCEMTVCLMSLLRVTGNGPG
ncbi:hypothetical protein EYF80_052403 [Liparis tanakae]|uniref:Uncharacterized protein n=1 Tax=Liparis tanakae TaxID=230148 RepID=A0A4Z2F8F6_9TELE|nr:hypothetical protein EYF80_052403 [Liparis tanakae]